MSVWGQSYFLQQSLSMDRGIGEMREEGGVGLPIRKKTRRGKAKRQQDEVLALLVAASEHHPLELRGKLQLADLHARLGKHRKLAQTMRAVEGALVEAEAQGEGHPLLLAEVWYRVALVYRHHERSSTAILRSAHEAAAASVRLSPFPAVEAVLLAYETALVLGERAEAGRFLRICEGTAGGGEGEVAAVPGCRERLEELQRQGMEQEARDDAQGTYSPTI